MRVILKKRSSHDIPFGLIYGTIALLALIGARTLPIGTLLPSCTFKSMTGVPCPTCGTTRLLTHLAQGDLSIAFCLNPAVAFILISAIVLFLYDAIVLFSGSRVAFSLSPRESQWIRSGAIVALLVNWVYLAVYL
jgi:hypothetical protein